MENARLKASVKRVLKAVFRSVIPYESVRRDIRLAWKSLLAAIFGLRAELAERRPKVWTNSGIKVNIGCGALKRDGWLNLDLVACEGVYYFNAINGIPLPNSSVTHLHCEHFLEHLELEDAKRFIAECFRVLGPGGGFRVIVPDAEKYIKAYASGDMEFFGNLRCLGGDPVPMGMPIEVVNRMFRMWGAHKFSWDYDLLAKVLQEAGFSRVLRSVHGDVAADLNIDGQDWWRPVESLYVNAQK